MNWYKLTKISNRNKITSKLSNKYRVSQYNISPEQIQNIINSYQQGETVENLANMYNIHPSTVMDFFKKDIINRYHKGDSARKISTDYNTTERYINELLRLNNVNISARYRYDFSTEEIQDIINSYQNEVPIAEINSKYNMTGKTLYKILEQNKIPKRRKILYPTNRYYREEPSPYGKPPIDNTGRYTLENNSSNTEDNNSLLTSLSWNLIPKIAQIQGEWWIDDSGSAMYADGDVGEYNHEMHVMESILHKYIDIPEFTDANSSEFIDGYIQENWDEAVDWMINTEGLITEEERQLAYGGLQNESTSNPGETFFELASNNMALSDILKMNGASQEESDIATGQGDARLYAAKNWGWVRVQGQNIESFDLSTSTLKRIANGLYDAYGEDAESSTYNIYSYVNQKWFNDIPFVVIESGRPGALRQFQFVGWG